MVLSFASALTVASVTGFGNGCDRARVDADEHALLVGRVLVGLADDLDDADDLLLVAGVIEEGVLALLHRFQVLARGEIAHAGPGSPLAPRFTWSSQENSSGSVFNSQYAIGVSVAVRRDWAW